MATKKTQVEKKEDTTAKKPAAKKVTTAAKSTAAKAKKEPAKAKEEEAPKAKAKATKATKATAEKATPVAKKEAPAPKPVAKKKVEEPIDPQDLEVEEKLRLLYSLQKIMSKIDEIKILRGDLPLEVQDLEDEILGLKTRANRYTTEIKEFEKNISNSKNAIAEAKMKIDKKTEQQKQVVNNREYEILSKEIENLDLDVQLSEKAIKDSNYEIDTRKKEFDELHDIIEEKSTDLKAKKEELEQIIVETKKEEEELRGNAKDIEANIEPRLLSAFKRIRKNSRNGLAVVPVERSSCSGCFSKIPPQRQLDIRQRRKIIVCENCGRVLIDHEMTQE